MHTHQFKRLQLLILLFSASLFAQYYPDTIWVPVTFYDFHADFSNPEFNVDRGSGLQRGMVADTLDEEGKPVLGDKPFFSHYIHKWYRPWQPGDSSAPLYDDGEFEEIVKLDHDTAFKNIVIHDSLPFRHIDEGMYTYENNNFFMLDSLGFGEEPDESGHNFSFTMEMHTTFTYKPGQTFLFRGDDDVWAFVDGKKVMDIGGVHNALTDSFSVDSLGLVPYQEYSFDFFYAERRQWHSTIKITTNMIGPPARVRLYPTETPQNNEYPPFVELSAGETLPLFSHVFDSGGNWRPEYGSEVVWELTGQNGNQQLPNSIGNENSFTPTEAGDDVTIRAIYRHPDVPDIYSTAEIVVRILPGKEHHIDILPDSTVEDLRNDADFHEIVLPVDENFDTVWAVIRDKYGNYIRHTDNVTWTSENTDVIVVDKSGFRGILEQHRGGQTYIHAHQGGLLPDSVFVRALSPLNQLARAFTRDTDGDGYLDLVELHFDSAVTVPQDIDPSSFIFKHAGTVLEVERIVDGDVRDSIIYAYLSGTTGGRLQTGWTLDADGSLPGCEPWQKFPVRDGAGPVIEKAVLIPAFGESPDSIRVRLSEPVKCEDLTFAKPEEIFDYFSDSLGQSYIPLQDADLKYSCGVTGVVSEMVIALNSMYNPLVYRDSLRLNGPVHDANDNRPHPESRKVPIGSSGKNQMQISFGRVDKIPKNALDFYRRTVGGGGEGILVGIQTIKPLLEIDGSYGEGIVFDAVGNLVRKGLEIKSTQSIKDYGLFWDGLNNNGRKVGGGGYLLVIKGKDVDGQPMEAKMKIAYPR